MNTCYIFGALDLESLAYLPDDKDYIIAADKGVKIAEKFSINPNVIIGDFDSLGEIPNRENVKILPVKKDDTDVGYCIKYAMGLGYKDFVIYGCIGGLVDHTVANLQLAVFCAENNCKVVFVGENSYITAIKNSSISINNGKGRVSIFCAGDVAKGVTLSGLEYPLFDATITKDFPIGVSNKFINDTATISVKEGTLLIISSSIL